MEAKTTDVSFPIRIRFDDGTTEDYFTVQDIEYNLEDFDSTLESGCEVVDSNGRKVKLIVKLLSVKEISFVD